MTTASASTPVRFPDDFDTRRLRDMSNLSAKDEFLALVGWRKSAMQAWSVVGVIGAILTLHPQKAMCMPPESLRHSKLLHQG